MNHPEAEAEFYKYLHSSNVWSLKDAFEAGFHAGGRIAIHDSAQLAPHLHRLAMFIVTGPDPVEAEDAA